MAKKYFIIVGSCVFLVGTILSANLSVCRANVTTPPLRLSEIAGPARMQEPSRTDTTSNSPEEPLDFSRDVLPVLSAKCFLCHGPDGESISDLRLDSLEAATEDRGGYRAIDPTNPEASSVLTRIHSVDDPMPPVDAEHPLTDSERALLTRWVREGGAYAQHWSFVPPSNVPPISAPLSTGAARIDAHVIDRLQAKGVAPARPAERWNLARRVSLVLTGLPPEPAELSAFLADDSEDAYEMFVDRLLNKSSFGEHQAKYWLDAVRYGDTHGLHLDNRRGIFPYRDWVVKAFNENLPLDDFITWQLAGDMLPAPTLEQQVATGFIRMNPTTAEGGAIPEEFQAKNSFDRTETFGTVFLGLSLTCARCHTHKYDPITHADYYRLLAYFNSTTESPMDGNRYDYQPIVPAPANQVQWRQWSEFEDDVFALISDFRQTSAGLLQSATDNWSTSDWLEQLSKSTDSESVPVEFKQRAEALSVRGQELKNAWSTTLVAKQLPQPRETRVLHRGEYDQPTGDPLEPAPLPILGGLPTNASNDRLGLAQWLLSDQQPLMPRVLANRFWAQVFGVGLVKTPEEFGLQGQQPTHPQLLDYLALELRTDWDLKRFLKMLVMTKTFRQSSAWRKDLEDPENEFLARGPHFRLDAEVIRDLLLVSSGRMLDEMGGEGFKPAQPAGMWEALAHPASNTKSYQEDKGPQVFRRSLYVYWKRTSPHPMMTLFDAPSRESSCVQRSRSNTPLQSLGLFNEPQRVQLARLTAHKLLQTPGSQRERLTNLYQQLVCRGPNAKELSVCESLVETMRDRFREFPSDATSLLDSAQIPDDVGSQSAQDPAELAAWTQLVLTILASDAVNTLY